MMNLRNLGSKRSLGIKRKGGICAEMCLKTNLIATGILVILLSQNGLESDCQNQSLSGVL